MRSAADITQLADVRRLTDDRTIPKVGDWYSPAPGQPPYKAIYFGNTPGTPHGITWTFTADAPSGDNGYVAATQLAKFSAHRYDFNHSLVGDTSSSGNYWLDACPIYASATQASGGTYTWTSWDSPGLVVQPSDSSADIDLQFQTYFMYRPGGVASIWVPIGELEWNMSGSAAKQGSPPQWFMFDSSWAANPSGAASTTFPVWTEVKEAPGTCPGRPSFSKASPLTARSRIKHVDKEVSR